MYADRETDSIKRAIAETERRRNKQVSYNQKNSITPKGVMKRIKDLIDGVYNADDARTGYAAAQAEARYEAMSEKQIAREMKALEKKMLEHARNLEFEEAARARDQLAELDRKSVV